MTRASRSIGKFVILIVCLGVHHRLPFCFAVVAPLTRSRIQSSPRGAYLHVPFCRRRCFYCNFPVIAVGERLTTQSKLSRKYTSLLLRELKLTAATATAADSQGVGASVITWRRPLESVYIGGGTPSLLPDDCIASILTILRETDAYGGIASNAEVTLELDPGTFDLERLNALWSVGVTRLSIGVQSFNDDILVKCGRAHTSGDVFKALHDVRSSPFRDNFSIDLISSLPFLSLPLWEDTLEQGLATGCSHISVYDLQVEEKTAFGHWYTPGVFPLPTDEDSAKMYRLGTEKLTAAGFEHYEVSNYAKPGRRSRHNQFYWQCVPTWGFGMGAASFVGNNRFSRPAKLSDYESWLDTLEMKGFDAATKIKSSSSGGDGLQPKYADEDCDAQDGLEDGLAGPLQPWHDSENGLDILEVVMLSMRTSDGLDLVEFEGRYGAHAVKKVLKAVDPYVQKGLVIVVHEMPSSGKLSPRVVKLADPDGFLISNDIISSVFVEFS